MIASDKTFNVLKHNVADVKQTPRYCSDSCNVCTISRPRPYITVMLFGNGITVINLSNSLAAIQDVEWTIKTIRTAGSPRPLSSLIFALSIQATDGDAWSDKLHALNDFWNSLTCCAKAPISACNYSCPPSIGTLVLSKNSLFILSDKAIHRLACFLLFM